MSLFDAWSRLPSISTIKILGAVVICVGWRAPSKLAHAILTNFESCRMRCLSIPPKHGKVTCVWILPRLIALNACNKDIYGTRTGKDQLEKDPIIFQRGPATNIIGIYPLTKHACSPLNLLTTLVANNVDHTRIRKLLSHAFSETALREQESILVHYFDLLIMRLKEQIRQPVMNKIDIMAWYNFTTFDIIGYV
ncbi:MAG: hypothetical protein Q9214_004527 [Letrouitia sp. 1 TL-2023]